MRVAKQAFVTRNEDLHYWSIVWFGVSKSFPTWFCNFGHEFLKVLGICFCVRWSRFAFALGWVGRNEREDRRLNVFIWLVSYKDEDVGDGGVKYSIANT